MSAAFSTLQTRSVALLAAASYFADIGVAEISDGTLAAKIQQLLFAKGFATTDGAKTIKRGLVCIVGIHAAAITGPKLRAEPLLRVAVLENPLINHGTGSLNKLPLDVCAEVFKALTNAPALDNVPAITATTRITPVDGAAALEIIGTDARRSLYGVEGGNAWHCNFIVRNLAL
jgi:hypothetical protein